MPQRIEDIMTDRVHSVPEHASVRQVARLMRDQQIGDVLVTDTSGKLSGIVTDRDLVVRAVAIGKDIEATKVSEICSHDVAVLPVDASVDEAVALMRDKAIRRVPVCRDGVPVGIVSIGDLAQRKDPRSALAEISSAPPTR